MNPPLSPGSLSRVKRESTAFSSFSTSSQSRGSCTGFAPSFPARERVPFTPELDVSVPRLPDVSGRSDLANYVIAEQLKNLFDTDVHPAPPTSSPSEDVKPDLFPSQSLSLPHASSSISSRLLSEAFRREYSATANDERKRAYSTMYPEEEEDRSSRFSRATSVAGSMYSQSERGSGSGGRKKFRATSQAPQALILPGLGEGKQRNVNGKSLYGGQDVGVGVIGSQAFLNDVGEDNGEVAMTQECDIPMSALGCDWRVRQIEGEEEKMKFMVGPHVVSLEEDLPPLAAEHPARVWNSILHSLPQELGPTVQWKYERVMGDDGVDEELMHICQLTLSLSPLHPAIANHPAFSQLPTNRHTAEYITAAAALGGSKTWTGEVSGVKTDATNSALVKCMSSGAFEWLHNASLEDPVHSLGTSQRGESLVLEAPIASETSTHPPPLTSPKSDDTTTDISEQSWEVVPFTGQVLHNTKPSEAKDSVEPLFITDIPSATQPIDPSVQIEQIVQEVFSVLPDVVKPVFSMTVDWDHSTKSFVETLKIGVETHTQSFRASSDATVHHFGTAVMASATEQGLHAFLKQLADCHQPLNCDAAPIGSKDDSPTGKIIDVPTVTSGEDADMLVDWVEQLKAFCRSNNLRFPVYTQQVEKLTDEGVNFRATMKLEEEVFRSSSACDTILQARQEIAHWVFSEHFGQKAITLEYQGGDGGFRGGRGGRGGGNKRGRGRW